MKQSLLEWAKKDEFFVRFAGPTTRAAIESLKGNIPPAASDFVIVNDNSKASNGAAMKMAPIALFCGGDIDRAVELTITVCKWTHNNNIALSGAAAIAAATAAALHENATLYDVVQAGLYGAGQGDQLGRRCGATLAGPSVEKRIQLAVALAQLAPDIDHAMNSISDIIGTGLAAAEAVPAVFGLMVAAKGDTLQAIYAAVNIGNDTDTIATMVGGVLGTLNGAKSLPENYLTILEKENAIDLRTMAAKIRKLL